jgi:hypothetical protein
MSHVLDGTPFAPTAIDNLELPEGEEQCPNDPAKPATKNSPKS